MIINKYHSAWVTITGKVFVDEWEMEDLAEKRYSEYIYKAKEEDESILTFLTEERKMKLFDEIASEKIRDLFPTDDPFKLVEPEIDLSTYK